MTDKELTEWERQSHVITVLTSREMGAWLGRRDNRLLREIRTEIEKPLREERYFDTADAKAQAIALNWCLEIIDKHIKEIES